MDSGAEKFRNHFTKSSARSVLAPTPLNATLQSIRRLVKNLDVVGSALGGTKGVKGGGAPGWPSVLPSPCVCLFHYYFVLRSAHGPGLLLW